MYTTRSLSLRYGGDGYNNCYSVIQNATDGSYTLVGRTDSYGAGNSDFWLVKTDSSGNHLWNETYGGADSDTCHSIINTVDGGYTLAGYSESYSASYDYWLVRTDSNGNHLWNETYGGNGYDEFDSMIMTADGGYALGGTIVVGEGNGDFWLVKTDSSGNHQWNKTYGDTGESYFEDFIQISDGSYLLAGTTYAFGAGGKDFWLIKTDVDGNEEWNETYGGTSDDRCFTFILTADGGLAMAGNTYSYGVGNDDIWLVKTDGAGIPEGLGPLTVVFPVMLVMLACLIWYKKRKIP